MVLPRFSDKIQNICYIGQDMQIHHEKQFHFYVLIAKCVDCIENMLSSIGAGRLGVRKWFKVHVLIEKTQDEIFQLYDIEYVKSVQPFNHKTLLAKLRILRIPDLLYSYQEGPVIYASKDIAHYLQNIDIDSNSVKNLDESLKLESFVHTIVVTVSYKELKTILWQSEIASHLHLSILIGEACDEKTSQDHREELESRYPESFVEISSSSYQNSYVLSRCLSHFGLKCNPHANGNNSAVVFGPSLKELRYQSKVPFVWGWQKWYISKKTEVALLVVADKKDLIACLSKYSGLTNNPAVFIEVLVTFQVLSEMEIVSLKELVENKMRVNSINIEVRDLKGESLINVMRKIGFTLWKKGSIPLIVQSDRTAVPNRIGELILVKNYAKKWTVKLFCKLITFVAVDLEDLRELLTRYNYEKVGQTSIEVLIGEHSKLDEVEIKRTVVERLSARGSDEMLLKYCDTQSSQAVAETLNKSYLLSMNDPNCCQVLYILGNGQKLPECISLVKSNLCSMNTLKRQSTLTSFLSRPDRIVVIASGKECSRAREIFDLNSYISDIRIDYVVCKQNRPELEEDELHQKIIELDLPMEV